MCGLLSTRRGLVVLASWVFVSATAACESTPYEVGEGDTVTESKDVTAADAGGSGGLPKDGTDVHGGQVSSRGGDTGADGSDSLAGAGQGGVGAGGVDARGGVGQGGRVAGGASPTGIGDAGTQSEGGKPAGGDSALGGRAVAGTGALGAGGESALLRGGSGGVGSSGLGGLGSGGSSAVSYGGTVATGGAPADGGTGSLGGGGGGATVSAGDGGVDGLGGANASGGTLPSVGGVASVGGATGSGYACARTAAPAGGLITDFTEFSSGAVRQGYLWTSSTGLSGSSYDYGSGDGNEITVTIEEGQLHLAASLASSGYLGFGLMLTDCVDASAFDSLAFDVTAGNLGEASMQLQLQTSHNTPIDDVAKRGECAFVSESTKWSDCTFCHAIEEQVTVGTTLVPFARFTYGKPVSSLDPSEVLAVQIQFECSVGAGCAVDLFLDNLRFALE